MYYGLESNLYNNQGSTVPQTTLPHHYSTLQPTPQRPTGEPPDLTTTANTFGREMANLAKSYTDDVKYGSEGDNFSLKLTVFYDIYGRVGILAEAYRKALPIILKGLILDYYYSDLINSSLTFDQLCQTIQQHFEDANYRRNTLTE